MENNTIDVQEKKYKSRKVLATHQLPVSTLQQEYLKVTAITVNNQTYLVDCYQTVYLSNNPYIIVGVYHPTTHTIKFLEPLPVLK